MNIQTDSEKFHKAIDAAREEYGKEIAIADAMKLKSYEKYMKVKEQAWEEYRGMAKSIDSARK